jgi:RNA polymerase sigma factor (sigma-70 family)
MATPRVSSSSSPARATTVNSASPSRPECPARERARGADGEGARVLYGPRKWFTRDELRSYLLREQDAEDLARAMAYANDVLVRSRVSRVSQAALRRLIENWLAEARRDYRAPGDGPIGFYLERRLRRQCDADLRLERGVRPGDLRGQILSADRDLEARAAGLAAAIEQYDPAKGSFGTLAHRLECKYAEEALREAAAERYGDGRPVLPEPAIRIRFRDRAADADRVAFGQAERDRLKVEYAGLAKNRAKRFRGRAKEVGLSWDDLHQEASVGLVQAAEHYDPTRGPFAPFAVRHIEGRLKAALKKAAAAPSPVCEHDPEEAAWKEREKSTERGVRPGVAPDVEGDSRKLLDEAVFPALRQFSPRDREIIKLGLCGQWWCDEFGERLPVTAVAARLRISPNTVRAVLSEFRAEVRRKAGKT